MSQPARVRDNRAKAKGRAIPPGPKASLDLDFLENNEYLTGQHNYDDAAASAAYRAAAEQLALLEAEGRESKARRLRKEINLATEAQWAVRSTWCPTCVNLFHNCQCDPGEVDKGASIDFIMDFHRRNGNLPPTKAERKQRRKEEARRKRLERRMKNG